jgi:hypothetical protein
MTTALEDAKQVIMNQLKTIEALTTLTNGCAVHPSYRATKKPVGNCRVCHLMWRARQLIEETPADPRSLPRWYRKVLAQTAEQDAAEAAG